MSNLQHPLFHVVAFSHYTARARPSGIVQVAKGALLHYINTTRCTTQHAVRVHDVGVSIVQASKLRNIKKLVLVASQSDTPTLTLGTCVQAAAPDWHVQLQIHFGVHAFGPMRCISRRFPSRLRQ
jgi:hypothetical protein